MSRRPPPNSINRSVLNDLNDRENLRKIIKSREFNLERQKELKKIIKETTENLVKAQKKKTNNLKKNRGKNLRGEYKINDALRRRYERGERRHNPGEEPRIVGDPVPIPAAAALLNPAVAKPPNVLPVKKVVPSIEPKIGAKKGKNASGCPVSGFVVKGTCDANPLTSAGFTWRSIESPKRPWAATFLVCCLISIYLSSSVVSHPNKLKLKWAASE